MQTWCEPVSDVAVRVEGLGKRYAVGGGAPYLSLRDSLAALPRRLLGRSRGRSGQAELWALKDVSFEVKQGEVLGIIGRNGAGKSTLLKILSRITRPTKGRAEVWGRVGSLLEIGTGFHPELSGRENIWLYGAILGLKRHEIQKKFDEIVAFSEVEAFLDTPIKHYSSGMQMRLAFSVAAHLEPEVLLVDEVLAVGDAAFQRKCLGKMEDVQKGGRTVLFVSHNMAAVQAVCSRVGWLDAGQIIEAGLARQVVSHYLTGMANFARQVEWQDRSQAPGNGGVYLRRAALQPVSADPGGPITLATPVECLFEYWNTVAGVRLNPTMKIFDEIGGLVFASAPVEDVEWYGRPHPVGLFRSRVVIPADLLNEGTYYVTLLLVRDEASVLYEAERLLTFRVEDDPQRRGQWYGVWGGVVRPRLPWRTEKVPEEERSLR